MAEVPAPSPSRSPSGRGLRAIPRPVTSLAFPLLSRDPKLRDLVAKSLAHLMEVTGVAGAGFAVADGLALDFCCREGSIPEGLRTPRAGSTVEACLTGVRARVVDWLLLAGTATRALVIPIRPGEQAIGAVVLVSSRPEAFDDAAIAAGELMGGLLEAAIARAAETELNEEVLADRSRAIAGWGESLALLQSFFATAPFRMAVIALEGEQVRYRAVNVAGATWLGTTPEALAGALADAGGAVTLAPPEVVAACLEAAKTTEPVRIEHAGVDPSGARHHLVTTVAPLALPSAGASHFCLVTEDVTLTVEMRGQLQLADRLASLGTLAAGIAHEINNPLSYVKTNLDFALAELKAAGTTDGDVTVALTESRDGVERMARIVRDLKTLSHPDAEDAEVADPAEAVSAALRVCRSEVQRRAKLELDLGPMPTVRGAGHRLIQVVLNLLMNAAQAIPPDHARDHVVRVRTATDSRGWARIEISDTGPGIPEAIQRKIFEPFFTTKPVGVGTGLGLSICHGIISGLGGDLSFQSAPGHGTTFTVLLPKAAAATEA